MPYTQEHKARTRGRIVECARRLFSRHGFAGVSIDEIMAEAALTRGGFYNHFATKDELYAEVVTYALESRKAQVANGQCAQLRTVGDFVSAYLSQAHFDDRETCCPLMALPSDAARGGEPVKRAYRQVLEHMVSYLETRFAGPQARKQALALASLCVGAMAVARAVDDGELAAEIRDAARDLANAFAASNERPAIIAAE